MKEAKVINIWEIMLHSGLVVQGVLLLLVISSIVSWAIILNKRRQFKLLDANNEEFQKKYSSASNFKEIVEVTQNISFSSYKSIFINGHKELSRLKKSCGGDQSNQLLKEHFKVYGLSTIERAIDQAVNETNVKLDELLSTLASVGSVSPFIGLFGTVWGIINSFTGIASGGATLDAVAPGIAEALVATAVGLGAAIPAVWFYNYFLNINNRQNVQMETFSKDLLNVIERSLISKN